MASSMVKQPQSNGPAPAATVPCTGERRRPQRNSTTMSVVETLPTTECATSSYKPPPGSVKPHIRRKAPATRRLSRLVHQVPESDVAAKSDHSDHVDPVATPAGHDRSRRDPAQEPTAQRVREHCVLCAVSVPLLAHDDWSAAIHPPGAQVDEQQRIHSPIYAAHLSAHRNDERVPDALAFVWWFSVPFRDLLDTGPFFIWFTLYHVIFVSKMLRADKEKLIKYMPLLLCQTSTLFIFEGIAITFKNVSANSQIALTLSFPINKALLKRMIWHYAHDLDDISTDVTVCVVEIFASLFQNICIQNVRLFKISALMIFIGFVQAVVETKMYLGHKFIVDGKVTVATAVKIVESALFSGVSKADQDRRYATSEHRRDRKPSLSGSSYRTTSQKTSSIILIEKKQTNGSRRDRSRSRVVSAGQDDMLDIGSIDPGAYLSSHNTSRNLGNAPGTPQSGGATPGGPTPSATRPSFKARQKVYVDDITLDHKELASLLTQTLQLLFASEVLVFVEYVEFITPLVYGLYSFALFHMPYAKYSLQFIGLSNSGFNWAMATTCLYATLECISMLLMFYLVKRKYGLSALYQLAFMLENYTLGIQGKLLGSLVLIFNLNTVHHGVDFSLEFNWETVLNGTSGSWGSISRLRAHKEGGFPSKRQPHT